MRRKTTARVLGLALLALGGLHARDSGAGSRAGFDEFTSKVQPLFTARREGLMTCATCHTGKVGTAFRLQPLAEGAASWSADDSRKNFEMAQRLVKPGLPLQSRLLTHPLERAAGGDSFHGGGKHWLTQADAEWQTLAAWVRGSARFPTSSPAPLPAGTAIRIVQTNAAGDGAHLIDPTTNRVTRILKGVEIPHGVTSSPDGARLYLSNEVRHTLDVVEMPSLRIAARVPLSGRPNNVAVSKDGAKVYVGIAQAPGALDVIDTVALKNVKTVPTKGAIHNVYVTPDGRWAVAGSIPEKTISIVDTATDTLARTIPLSAGIRPMAFTTRPDGSTGLIIVQLSDFHGFVTVDFTTGKETARVEHPAIEGEHPHTDGLQGAPAHGLAVSPDGTRLWSTSKVYGYAYVHSLPDLREVGRVFVGQHPEWVTFTPDGKYIYVAAAGDNSVFVVDAVAMKEVARIPVGNVPKRNATAALRVP
ncbi:MAG: YncE family protein [Vicinamibacterales bacterium]